MASKDISLTLEVVTPMFLGGANPSECELREQSIIGCLRWWFRAVAGASITNLNTLHDEEAKIFGSTDRKSRLQVRVLTDSINTNNQTINTRRLTAETIDGSGNFNRVNELVIQRNGKKILSRPLTYMGYGVMDFNGRPNRANRSANYIQPEGFFKIRISYPEKMDNEEKLLKAIWCWVHLGGLGAKSRKGFGSLSCKSEEGWPTNIEGVPPIIIKGELNSFLIDGLNSVLYGVTVTGIPEWTAFSSNSKVYISQNPFTSWQDAIEAMGAWMIGFRRRYGMSNGRDYAWAHSPRNLKGVPDKAGFGLPLKWGQDGAECEIFKPRQNREKLERRASPLLHHVTKVDNQYKAVLTHLPSELIPNGYEIKLKHKADSISSYPTIEQISIITDYLTQLDTNGVIQCIR